MRTKPCARYVARVVDLSRQNHRQVEETSGQFATLPVHLAPIQPHPAHVNNHLLAQPTATANPSADIGAALRQQRKPRKSTVTERVASGQSPVPRAYQRKQRTKDGKVSKDGAATAGTSTISNFTTTSSANIPAGFVQANANNGGGLYRVDFSRLLEHNLQGAMQQRAVVPSPNTYARCVPMQDPRVVQADHTLAVWRQLMMASIALQRNQQATQPILRPSSFPILTPTVATGSKRFSIFRSVELMAQSSCPSAMAKK
uniref:Uncharacterized protein n=1 Tax=Anopheles atroparvus TaxID=41427 RepID=A0AAG5D9X2_ANOAO